MDDVRDSLAARQFTAMPLSGDVQNVRDEQNGREQDTAVDAWKKPWRH